MARQNRKRKDDFLNTNISILITSKCTLNCEYCSSGIPYHTCRKDIPSAEIVDQIQKILTLYIDAGVYIEHLDFLGGEPLLHPDFNNIHSDIIEKICKFSDSFHEMRILTNGTLLPKEELLQTIKAANEKMNFLMIISDYGSLSPKTDEICELLKKYGLNFRVDRYSGDSQYFGGWVSYGQDGIVSGTTEERYQECAFYQSGVAEVFDGLLFPCPRALALHITGRSILPEAEYINLHDEHTENVKKLSAFLIREVPYAACKNCTGLCKGATRYPAATQLVKK